MKVTPSAVRGKHFVYYHPYDGPSTPALCECGRHLEYIYGATSWCPAEQHRDLPTPAGMYYNVQTSEILDRLVCRPEEKEPDE